MRLNNDENVSKTPAKIVENQLLDLLLCVTKSFGVIKHNSHTHCTIASHTKCISSTPQTPLTKTPPIVPHTLPQFEGVCALVGPKY